MRCLIVDDSPVVRKNLESYLENSYECDLVDNGGDAVEAVGNSIKEGVPYDLVTLDINMPGMDGHESLKLIRQIENSFGVSRQDGVIVVMTTACDDRDNVIEAGKAGCQGYLVKPFTKAMLLDEIDKLIAIKEEMKPKSKLKALFFGS